MDIKKTITFSLLESDIIANFHRLIEIVCPKFIECDECPFYDKKANQCSVNNAHLEEMLKGWDYGTKLTVKIDS